MTTSDSDSRPTDAGSEPLESVAEASEPGGPTSSPPPAKPGQRKLNRGESRSEGGRKESRPRWWRRHRALTALLLFPLLLAIPVGVWVIHLNNQLGNVPKFEVNLDRPDRPAAQKGSDAVNILLAGLDDLDRDSGPSLKDALSEGEWPQGIFRSDAILVLHIDDSRDTAQLVSIPRDSYVPVPGYGKTKINAAFSYGGPELLAKTVEDLTQIRIDHIAVIDFDGLAKITDIVGGVPITVTSSEPKPDGGTWEPGTHVMNGEEALAYVRVRKSLPNGDFGRVQRQQNYLRAVLNEVVSAGTLRSPRKFTKLVGALDDTLAVDDDLSSGKMRSLGWSLRGLRPGGISYATVPHFGSATIDGASIVKLDEASVLAMFRAAREDRLPKWLADNPEAERLPAPEDVR